MIRWLKQIALWLLDLFGLPGIEDVETEE